MTDPLRIHQLGMEPVGPIQTERRTLEAPGGAQTSFADALRRAQQASPAALRFSAHAQTRILAREIPVGPAELQRIEGAVQRAAARGARESLVLLDQAAFIVSVPNRTVITAVDKENLKDSVFTSIDSAVIA